MELANDTEGESIMYLFEIFAVILTVFVANQLQDGTPGACVLCIDNEAALVALVKGSPTSALGAILVGGVLEPRGPNPRSVVSRVRKHTKSNDADEPSRARSSQEGENALSTTG